MQTSYQEDEIEIDLQDLFGLLLHKAWIIILAAIVAGAIGFVVSFFSDHTAVRIHDQHLYLYQ